MDLAKPRFTQNNYCVKFERDLTEPSLRSLRRIADALNVPLLYFLDEENTQPIVRRNHHKRLHLKMEVTIKYFSVFRSLTNKVEENIGLAAGATINDVLEYLVKQYGSKMEEMLFSRKKLKGYIRITVNGKIVRDVQEYELHDQDNLYLIIALAGG